MFAPYTSLILVAVIFLLMLLVSSFRDSSQVEESTEQLLCSNDVISFQTYEQSGRPKWEYLN